MKDVNVTSLETAQFIVNNLNKYKVESGRWKVMKTNIVLSENVFTVDFVFFLLPLGFLTAFARGRWGY